MKLYIKNMVCDRCILVVNQELEKLHIKASAVSLGEVESICDISPEEIQKLKDKLGSLGFEILNNNKQHLIEKIRSIIIKHVHYPVQNERHNLSDILSEQLHKDYSYLSSLFSEVEGITIEKYLILQKIEKVKELIIYDQLNFSEIAEKLGYSSVAHLSNQFKKITGLTPTYFRQVGQNKRKPLDEV